MLTTPSFESTTQTPSTTAKPSRLMVDAPTRMFHWLFALSFLGAYITADGERWRSLHITLGYTLAGLLAFRVLYGLIGPRQAGLGAMYRKLSSAPLWLKSTHDKPHPNINQLAPGSKPVDGASDRGFTGDGGAADLEWLWCL